MSQKEDMGESTPNARVVDDAAAAWMEIDDLVPWDKNPRHNDGAVPQVAESIIRFGFSSPIIVRSEDGRIIAGHTRWKAAHRLAALWESSTDRERARWHPDAVRVATQRVAPVRALDLSEHDANLLALADNRLNEIAPWNRPLLQQLLSEHSIEDVQLAGWSSDDVARMAEDMLDQNSSELSEATTLMDETDAGPEPPDDFASFDESIETEHKCPKCGYEWSGKAK